jgi:NADH dehydrogenase
VILVAGGTGRLGTLVVARLAADGHEVRVLSRAMSPGPVPDGVEFVRADVRDKASITTAFDGVTTLVSAVHGFTGPGKVTPDSVDRDGNANLVDLAVASGADVVLMSIVGAAPDSPMELFRAKYAAEQHLRDRRARFTIVRSTAFVELWAEIMAKPIVFGHGDNPINFVSVNDVAEVVVRAVTNPALRGMVLEVGGPENVTFNDLAARLQRVRGTAVRVRHVPRFALRLGGLFDRRARAGLAMDSVDLTFDAAAARSAWADLPMTDLDAALSRAVIGAAGR